MPNDTTDKGKAPQPNEREEKLEEILTKLENAVEHEVLLRQSGSKAGRNPKSIHREALDAITTHTNKATRKASIATAQLIFNTCRYEGRELYISSFAVEQLIKDLKDNDNSRKALTALKAELNRINKGGEDG